MENIERVKYFEDLLSKEPYSWKDIYYKGKTRKLPVYEINLDYLIYNQWNGRIASLVKSYYNETGIEVDASTQKGVELIESFLMASHAVANDNTEENIYTQGQLEYGIVTKDGVVIDGNRRSMLLRRVAKRKNENPAYFLGVVLEECLNDNPREIMSLETRYQMGEDAKVDYNPIEKYLKCKEMHSDYNFSTAEIAKDMGEKESVIKENLKIMSLMDEYLNSLDYNGIYTRLKSTEDLFINLNKVLQKWNDSSGKVNWDFDESDLSDYKQIMFDLIRYTYNTHKGKGIDSKEIREKLIRNSEDTFFAHENIWKEFSKKHNELISPKVESEKSVDELKEKYPEKSLSEILKFRDEEWAQEVNPIVKENFGRASNNLENLKDSNQPLKLLNASLDKLEAINTDLQSFLNDDEVFNIVRQINSLTYDFTNIIKNYKKSK